MSTDVSTNFHESDSLEFPLSPAASRVGNEALFDPLIGQRIGSFQIEERLGAGAMASIYRAIDTTDGKQVALKLLSATADEILRERFRMEARTVRALQHPHILQIIDSGQTDQGTPYLVMELVAGEDLGTFLEKRHQLSVLDSCRLLQPIAAALAHAHTAGVIHRDVKPSNILLRRVPPRTPYSVQLTEMTDAVIPLLSDFGIARAVDAPELTTLGRTIGTPAYMSPEQCAGQRQLDGRADLYSLGAVLYRCLVGRAPFVGTTTQLLHAHVYETLTMPDAVWRALPPVMLTILRKTLQKEPDERYAHAGTLADDLALMIQEATPADATATMPSLPATGNPTDSLMQVLVPGLGDKAKERPVIPWIPAAEPSTPPTRTGVATATGRRARPPLNWAAILLGILLSVGVLLLAFVIFTTLLPRLNLTLSFPGSGISRELTQVPSAALPLPGIANPDATQMGTDPGTNLPASTNPVVAPSPNRPISTVDGTTVVTATMPSVVPPSPVPPLDVAKTWQDVQHFYQNGAWGQARWSLMTMLSAEDGIPDLALTNRYPISQVQQINATLLDVPDARYWEKWVEDFTVDEVGESLANVYLSLALSDLTRLSDLSQVSIQTTDYLTAAATVRSASPLVRQLSLLTLRFLADGPSEESATAVTVANAYRAYAAERFATQAICAAATTLVAAERLVPGRIDRPLLESYAKDCNGFVLPPLPETTPQLLTGTIYYSTQIDTTYSIWRVPATQSAAASLVVQNGSQPSIYGNHMAFYSRRSDTEGLSGLDLSGNFAPNDRFPRYTGAVEDARESPARWNTTGEQLVFSSTDSGDGKSRLYLVPADYNQSTKRDLGLGEDPVWSPDGTMILYRNTGETGNTPGLVLYSVDTATNQRLTNAEDRRPLWTPDGSSIIFMRRLDDRNWELFRLFMGTGELIQLTNDPAQDGLPALSPDGSTIVFASDRTGGWQLWTIGLNESELGNDEARLLMPIQGTFLQWLEHSIQWVN